MLQLPPGSKLEGRYEILALIGKGGLGTVYKAKQKDFERIVAIKFLHGSIAEDESKERFRREGMALASLKHKNFPHLYSFSFWRDQIPYLVMEYLPGNTLRKEISNLSKIPWQRTLEIAKQICAAMQLAHDSGLVHRDLKPENLILSDSEDTVKICDFGLVRFLDTKESNLVTLTETGFLIGSVQYMSPEICQGQKADHRSDIYSFGCLLYEMLCGRPPFEADTPLATVYMHINNEVPPLADDLLLPVGLEGIVYKALSKDPDKRHQQMNELAAELNELSTEIPPDNLSRKSRSRSAFSKKKQKQNTSTIVMLATAITVCLLACFISAYYKQNLDASRKIPLDQVKSSPGAKKIKRIATSISDLRRSIAEFRIKEDWAQFKAMQLRLAAELHKQNQFRDEAELYLSMIHKELETRNWKQARLYLKKATECFPYKENDDPDMASQISLAEASIHYSSWGDSGAQEDLDQALSLARQAVELRKKIPGDQYIPVFEQQLAAALFWSKPDESIQILEKIVSGNSAASEEEHGERFFDAKPWRKVYLQTGVTDRESQIQSPASIAEQDARSLLAKEYILLGRKNKAARNFRVAFYLLKQNPEQPVDKRITLILLFGPPQSPLKKQLEYGKHLKDACLIAREDFLDVYMLAAAFGIPEVPEKVDFLLNVFSRFQKAYHNQKEKFKQIGDDYIEQILLIPCICSKENERSLLNFLDDYLPDSTPAKAVNICLRLGNKADEEVARKIYRKLLEMKVTNTHPELKPETLFARAELDSMNGEYDKANKILQDLAKNQKDKNEAENIPGFSTSFSAMKRLDCARYYCQILLKRDLRGSDWRLVRDTLAKEDKFDRGILIDRFINTDEFKKQVKNLSPEELVADTYMRLLNRKASSREITSWLPHYHQRGLYFIRQIAACKEFIKKIPEKFK